MPTWADRVVFFDIETTGLSGGAGTLAFLAGCGWFEDDGFRVRQFFLSGPAGERAMLDALADDLRRRVAARHVQRPDVRRAVHGDALGVPSPSSADRRRCRTSTCCRRRAGSGAGASDDGASCSLSALERSRARRSSRRRRARASRFRRGTFSSCARAMRGAIEGVLEHNRHDLVSLAARHRARAVAGARRAGGVPRRRASSWRSAGSTSVRATRARAAGAYELAARASDRASPPPGARAAGGAADGGRVGTTRRRRRGRTCSDLATLEPASPLVALERRAAEALAIHHEHRARDLETARRYAETLGARATGAAGRREARHRLGSIGSKADDVDAKRDDGAGQASDRSRLTALRLGSSCDGLGGLGRLGRLPCGPRPSARRTAW